jgi:hypothetical protein
LQALCPLQIGLSKSVIQVDSNTQILYCLCEIATAREYQAPQIKVPRDIILTLFNGLVNISHCLIKVVDIKVDYSAMVVHITDVVVGQLREEANSFV